MATSAILSHLRRSRPSSSLSNLCATQFSKHDHFASPQSPPPPASPQSPPPPASVSSAPFHTHRTYSSTRISSLAFLGGFHSRAFSTSSIDSDDSEIGRFDSDPATNSSFDREPSNVKLSKIIDDVTGGGTIGEELSFPVRAVISLLDGYHDLSGFPWWFIIPSFTLAVRIALLPVLILQLQKLKRIAELFPKLPPPFPPPFSGKSFIDQFLLFRKERKAVGCPSFLWQLVAFTVQVPCFFLLMAGIRRMSLDGHPGFDCGGALWFQNLTELPHGYTGIIFPLLIAGLHYIIVQISFQKSLVGKAKGIVALLAKYYKLYLDLLTLPIGFIGFCIPQGSLLYWVTNSSLTIIQTLAMRHPAVLAKLGLQDRNAQTKVSEELGAPKMVSMGSLGLQEKDSHTAASEEISAMTAPPLVSPEKWHKIPVEDLSPEELTKLSIPFLSNKDQESAIPLLKLALDKDPDYLRALVLMGRLLLLKHLDIEAKEHFEQAISKLACADHLLDAEEVDLLILSSQWAGVACERQGKKAEGHVHFERIANMEEPEDPTSKGYYFDGLLLFASSLYDAGRKDEAAKYLRLVVNYKPAPAYKKLLERCEQDDDIASGLASSRRGF